MSAFDTRRRQMKQGPATKADLRGIRRAQRIMQLNPRGINISGGSYTRELPITDSLTGISWRNQYPDMPMHVEAGRSTSYVHLKCIVDKYFDLTLGLNRHMTVKLTLRADVPMGERCVSCGEEF